MSITNGLGAGAHSWIAVAYGKLQRLPQHVRRITLAQAMGWHLDQINPPTLPGIPAAPLYFVARGPAEPALRNGNGDPHWHADKLTAWQLGTPDFWRDLEAAFEARNWLLGLALSHNKHEINAALMFKKHLQETAGSFHLTGPQWLHNMTDAVWSIAYAFELIPNGGPVEIGGAGGNDGRE